MRIAVITNSVDQTGGAGRIASMYNDLLRARGHEVRAWGPSSDFLNLGTRNALSRFMFHLRDRSAQTRIVDEIAEWKPNAILTHNLTGCGFGTPVTLLKRSRQKCNWVHVLHDVQLFEPSGQIVFGESFAPLRSIWRWKWALLRRMSFGRPDAVVSPTKWLLEMHRRHGFFRHVKSVVIPNPVLTLPLTKGELEGVDRQGLLYVGRLDRDKGVDLLIDAWKSLRSSASKLVLIGDGTMRQDVERLNDSTIDIRGPQSNDAVIAAMKENAVIVVPSRVMENQPTVILEALAAGCRVVASDVGGVRETLGDAGWIVKPDSVEDLVKGITDALHAPEDPRRETARQEILHAHEPDRSVERLLRLFQ